MEEFLRGCRRSLPIALGYFPVSFSFWVFVASSGLPFGLATLISLTNLTSSAICRSIFDAGSSFVYGNCINIIDD